MEKTDDSLKKLQAVNLEMIKQFIHICEKYDLRHYALGGTLLGAVRHGGFIPWDDDVDLGMPRPDYEKFLQVAPGELSGGYRLRTIDTNEEYRTYITRIENQNMKFWREFHSKTGVVRRIVYAWIDIMPIDGAPDDCGRFERHMSELKRKKQMLSFSLLDKLLAIGKQRGRKADLLMRIGFATGVYRCLNPKKQFQRFDEQCRKYSFETSPLLGNAYGVYGAREFVKREIFGMPVELPFEDISIRGPEDYRAYLFHVYGDYMKLPPEEERKGHRIELIEEEKNVLSFQGNGL